MLAVKNEMKSSLNICTCRREVSLELSHGCSVGSLAMANSIEQNRASSLSSEEATEATASGGQPQLANSNSLESKERSYPSSPRAERKPKNTPNTLTVQIPYGAPSAPAASAPQTPIENTIHRGISYPPLSPKSSLRRSKAVSQQPSINKDKNPPLSKSQRQVSASDGITIPVITQSSEGGQEDQVELEEKAILEQPQPSPPEEKQQSRKGRPDRADARRYHTAGAIEDIKVHNRISLAHWGKIPHFIQKSHFENINFCTKFTFSKHHF